MYDLNPDAQAELFRSDGNRSDRAVARDAPIREGRLFDMVSVVMTDPRSEVWRYTIVTDEGLLLTPDQIIDLAKFFGFTPV